MRGQYHRNLHTNNLIIDIDNNSYLFSHGFLDDTILALRLDGTEGYAIMINETKSKTTLNSLEAVNDFLEDKYLKRPVLQTIEFTSTNSSSKAIEKKVRVLNKDLNPIRNQETGKWGYVNRSNALMIDFLFDGAYDFSENLGLVKITVNKNEKYGYIDEEGNLVIKPDFEFAESFNEGFAAVRKNRKFGFIDKNGKVVIDYLFDNAESFQGGKAKVTIKNKTYFIAREEIE